MRQFKFRVWSPKVKEMSFFTNFLVGYSSGYAKLLYFMEWTGLKDKNEKEIYEGDILETNGCDGKLLWEVHYELDSDGSFGAFVADSINTNENYSSVHNEVIDKGIVIGNIFENPELIKK